MEKKTNEISHVSKTISKYQKKKVKIRREKRRHENKRESHF